MEQNEPKTTCNSIHIGQEIKRVLIEERRSAHWLAMKLYCDRTNVYKLFKKSSIDTALLLRISIALKHNFFEYYSNRLDSKE